MIWRNLKNGRKIGRAGLGVHFSKGLIRKDFTIKVTFQKTPGGDEGESMWVWECHWQNGEIEPKP